MPYLFDPHKHVKIWLSTKRDSFLNPDNQLRLVNMRAKNPHDLIYFVYDSVLLSPEAKRDLYHFCHTHRLKGRDVRRHVFRQCKTALELGLIEIYEDNIRHLAEGGNVAVGSDLLRWLKPIYQLGTYTDLDVVVDTSKLPPSLTVERCLLMNIGSVFYTEGYQYESCNLNNDIVAVVDLEAAKPLIDRVQQALYDGCRAREDLSVFEESKLMMNARCQELFGLNFKTIQYHDRLHEWSHGLSARMFRAEIMTRTVDNAHFCALEDCTEEVFATRKRHEYRDYWVLANLDSSDLVSAFRTHFQKDALLQSVIYTSGPGRLLHVVLPHALYKTGAEFNREVSGFSMAQYGLDKAFYSSNAMPLHVSKAEYDERINNTQCRGDLSWVPSGVMAMQERDNCLHQSAQRIQQALRFWKGRAAKPTRLPPEIIDWPEQLKQMTLSDLCFYHPNTIRKHIREALDRNKPEILQWLLEKKGVMLSDLNWVPWALVDEIGVRWPELTDRFFDIKQADSEGQTLLHYAVAHARHELVLSLIQAGLELEATDNKGQTPLHGARDLPMLERLIDDCGANIQAVDHAGLTLIAKILQERRTRLNEALIIWLLRKGALFPTTGAVARLDSLYKNLRQIPYEDWMIRLPPLKTLQEAMDTEDKEWLAYLINKKDRAGYTPLMRVTTAFEVHLLVLHGACVNGYPSIVEGYSLPGPLHGASNADVVRTLVAHGADVNAPVIGVGSPIFFAKRVEVVLALLAAGAKVTDLNDAGNTPLHLADNAEVAQALIDAGASLWVINHEGKTPLERAASCPDVQEVIEAALLRSAPTPG